MLTNRLIILAISIFCLPLGIVTTLQIEHLQPEWVWLGLRYLLAVTAGISWAGGIAISFYLRAMYGNSIGLLAIGGIGMGAFYLTYYTGFAGTWFGPAYAALTAAFDFLWLERVLHCVGVAQKERIGVDAARETTQIARLDAETRKIATQNERLRLQNERKSLLATVTETRIRKVTAPVTQEATQLSLAASGGYACACGRAFPTSQAYAGHKRRCKGVV